MKSLLKKLLIFSIFILSTCTVYFTGAFLEYFIVDVSNITIYKYALLIDTANSILPRMMLGILIWGFIIISNVIISEMLYSPKKSKTEKRFDVTKHGDFRKYYDTTQKRNYWVLGYFGGGSLNVIDAYEAAKQFSESVGIPIDSVQIDEIFKSRRFKGFKYLYSKAENQEPDKNSDIMKDVWSWLGD